MSWTSIIGHEEAIRRLRAAVASNRLHPALLFEGPEGVGKALVALTLARALHCPRAPERGGDPCGQCRICVAITASAEPDVAAGNQSVSPAVRVVTLSRPDERELPFGGSTSRGEIRSQITVPQIRVVLSEGITRDLAHGPRVVIVDPADRLSESAANALLKTLEEPPAGERFVLVTAKASALLPTILSRCCRYRFRPLSTDEIRSALERFRGGAAGVPKRPSTSAEPDPDRASRGASGRGDPGSPAPPHSPAPRAGGTAAHRTDPGRDLDFVAALSGGRIGRALRLADGSSAAAFREIRRRLLLALGELARGLPAGTFAVLAGASFRAREREDWLEEIGVLETLLRDLAVLAVDADARIANDDERARLQDLAGPLGGRAARALGKLDSVRSDLRLNVNGRLAAERILIELAG